MTAKERMMADGDMLDALEEEQAFDGAADMPEGGFRKLRENGHREYKTSFFVDSNGYPGKSQMMVIATTLCGFMNAGGGTLWLGIRDDGEVAGIGRDLALLAQQPGTFEIRVPGKADVDFRYGGGTDGYERKLRRAVEAFLSENALFLIEEIDFPQYKGTTLCRIRVKGCKEGDVVYFNQFDKSSHSVREDIYLRNGNSTISLQGRRRDEYIREREQAKLNKWWAAWGCNQPQMAVVA